MTINISKPGMVIAIANLKGGSGKTTLTGALMLQLQNRLGGSGALKVGAVDADGDSNLSLWLGPALGEKKPDHCASRTDKAILRLPFPSEDERQSGTGKSNPTGYWIEAVKDHRQNHDLTFIDLPPHSKRALLTGISIADFIILPMAPTPAEITSTETSISLIRRLASWRRTPPIMAVQPNRIFADEQLQTCQKWAKIMRLDVLPHLSWHSTLASCQNQFTLEQSRSCDEELNRLTNTLIMRVQEFHKTQPKAIPS